MVDRPQQVTSDTKQILSDSVYRQEPLCLSPGLEPSHPSFSLAGWLVRDFHAVIRVSSGFVGDRRHGCPMRSTVALGREENRVLKQQLRGKRLRLTDAQRRRLAAKGKALAYCLFSRSVNQVPAQRWGDGHREIRWREEGGRWGYAARR